MIQIPFLGLAAAHSEIRSEIDAALHRVIDAGRFVLGPELEAFECEFAAYCGAGHCVGVGNGLDALRLILQASGIGPGDEVIVPAQTFVATWLAVSSVGATPVPVDIDASSSNIDPGRVEDAVTTRTRAVVGVHLFGKPCDMAALRRITDRAGLLLVEDAAQAHGASLGGRCAGSLGDAAAFSFYPAKNLGALGDGGAVTTSDRELAHRVRLLRNYGSRVKYCHEVLGENSRLDELQAAVLRVKLRRLDEWNARRRSGAAQYLEQLGTLPGLSLPVADGNGSKSSWHLFVVSVEGRDEIAASLRDLGIETGIHYPHPPHLTKAYRKVMGSQLSMPVSEEAAAHCLSLPLGPHIASTQIQTVCSALIQFWDLSGRDGKA